jgi:ABC-type Na+ transport system ATPase subunit NatA
MAYILMTKPTYYSVTPASVRYDTQIAKGARSLYGEMTVLSTKRGYCFASNSYFADLYGVSTRTIQRWIEQLKRRKHIYVTIEKRRHRRIYNLRPDKEV